MRTLDSREEFQAWHNWTDPDFFAGHRHREQRFLPLFLRQLFAPRERRTKLTLTGWMLVLVAMAMGTAAYNTSSNILFMTLSLLLSSLILSGILSTINFRKLDWAFRVPEHLRAGDVGMAEITLENKKSVFPTMNLCFRMESSDSPEPARLYQPHAVAAGRTMRVEWTFVPKRRGYCSVRLAGVESEFPFGFLLKRMGGSLEKKVLVWPPRADYEFQPEGNGRRFLTGTPTRNAGIGSDLLNIRAYERGDPPRLVHWKASARVGRLMVRQLAQEGESGYRLVLDPDAGLWDARTFERLCSTALSLAEDLFYAGKLMAVAIIGQSATPVRGLRELHEFFDRLALLERRIEAADAGKGGGSNTITLYPGEKGDVRIYVDGTQVGQAYD